MTMRPTRRSLVARPGVVTCVVLLALLAAVLSACATGAGGGQDLPTTSTTAGPVSSSGGLGTAAPTSGSSSSGVAGTTVFSGTTLTGVGSLWPLTFVGPVSQATWRAIRDIVITARGDGVQVLSGVAALAAGPPVEVSSTEIDAVRGIGYTAGADTSQPVGVASEESGGQVIILAYGVTGHSEQTTIAGFERRTNHVVLVEGPLPITDTTGNITTVP